MISPVRISNRQPSEPNRTSLRQMSAWIEDVAREIQGASPRSALLMRRAARQLKLDLRSVSRPSPETETASPVAANAP